jgi:phospholipid/cholesterol/gamma-HCH transport system substrate-binding protein
VHALFENAGQIVKGNLVTIGGQQVGTVTHLALAANGQAELTLSIDDAHAPLRNGVHATVRSPSLGSVAGRYVQLDLPQGSPPAIPDGGEIPATDTTSAVEVDQIFDTFGPRERRALSGLIRGFGRQYAGRGEEANAAIAYLDPAVISSARLFQEIDRDPASLRRFVDSSARLVTDISARREALSGLVDHLATTTGAIGRRHEALASAVHVLPDFMRHANTTFVNLRSTLDDLQPLVDESKPVARKLRPFHTQLRPYVLDARPTDHDLAQLIRRAGPSNDLVDLARGAVPLRDIAINPVQANGKQREGAFPASIKALHQSTPELGYGRPYTVDLLGWFDDFSHSGVYDALGAASRAANTANIFTVQNGLPTGDIIPVDQRANVFSNTAQVNQRDRCPGSAERDTGDHTTPYWYPGYPCDPKQVPLGP